MNNLLFLALITLLRGSRVDAAISRSLQAYEKIRGRECFRSLNGMMQSMKDLAAKYPHLMTINTIGESYIKNTRQSPDKGKMLIASRVHAREWQPPSSTQGLLKQKYPRSMWRKNLNPVGCDGGSGGGVDINRNFDFMWGDTRGSTNSEPETQALVDYAMKLFPEGQRKKKPEKQKDEAFGEEISGELYYPWGFDDIKSPDDEAFKPWGENSILSIHTGYGPAHNLTIDYMYANMGVASMLYEIGSRFHQPCAEFEDELDARHDNGELRVSATASDGKMVNAIQISSEEFKNSSDYPTGSQVIKAVYVYLDLHPDDWQEGDIRWDMDAIDGNWDTNEESVRLTVSTKDFPSGKHIVHLQAIDSLGYAGPVSESAPAPGTTSPSFHQAAKGCLKRLNNEQVDLCLANEHTSNIAINCCSGSQQNGDLTCSRTGCKQTMSYDEAKAHCESMSMRLCTTAELEARVCCGKGCYFNKLPTWTSDMCEEI
ncbi:M14 family metallopeptidase [Skeletonema marinoi]|uniref:M14 family metallopeptidase n=1 Tax=Skeletonema marinoi TaxID=267567 RepID=A0AAD8Y163_9STRA|nr:M14 family metallopeptidase [Skeletonema marinoi]